MSDEPVDIMSSTIFRAVGGNSHRSKYDEYEIIPYGIVKETKEYWWLHRMDEPIKLQNKKEQTSNSRWYLTIDEALNDLLERIDLELVSMVETFDTIKEMKYQSKTLYICKFKQGKFTMNTHYVLKETHKGWKVETFETRTGIRRGEEGKIINVPDLPKGRAYHYKRESDLHNPMRPYETWLYTDLALLQHVVEVYFKTRYRYLKQHREELKEWVNTAKRIAN